MTTRGYARRVRQLLRTHPRALPRLLGSRLGALRQRVRTLPPRQTALVVAGAVLGAGTVASSLAAAWQVGLALLGLLLFLLVVAVAQARGRTAAEYAAVRDALHAERRAAAERERAQTARYDETVQWLARLEEQHRRLLGTLERERLDAADFREELRTQGRPAPGAPAPDAQESVPAQVSSTQVSAPRQQVPRGSAG